MGLNHDRQQARSLFAALIAAGKTTDEAAQVVWEDLSTRRPRRRARDWSEATGPLNTSGRRNFVCPLGQELQIEGAMEPFGQFCSRWPRTLASIAEAGAVRDRVISFLRGES